MDNINEELKEIVGYECICSKCHKPFIFKSKYFDAEMFDNMCPECYKNEN